MNMAKLTRRAFIQHAIAVGVAGRPVIRRYDDLVVVNCVARPPAPMIGAWSTIGPAGEFSSAQAWADSLPMRIDRGATYRALVGRAHGGACRGRFT